MEANKNMVYSATVDEAKYPFSFRGNEEREGTPF